MKKVIYASLCIVSLILSSCQNDPGDNITKVEDSSYDASIQKIISLGFNPNRIEDKGTFYLVEGDIAISKESLGLLKVSQGACEYLIDYNKVNNIVVKVDPSIPLSEEDNWREAVEQAIIDWNSISGSRIHMIFDQSSTNPDIIIKSDSNSLGINTLAFGYYPANGMPGSTIIINLDFLYNIPLSFSEKRFCMVHELGHCLGLKHTNTNALHIPGTPQSDPNSIMNDGTAGNSWQGFSYYDIAAAIALYTNGYWTNITPDGRFVQISVGSSSNIWGLNAQGRIYKWNGSDWTNITPAGALINISVASDGTVWGLNTNQQPVQWNGVDWVSKPGTLRQISVGSSSNIWGLNSQGRIYKWNGRDWTNITPAGALKWIAAGSDGTVWGINMSNQPVSWNGTDWQIRPGELSMISVGGSNNIWGVNAQNDIFKWNGSDWQNITFGGRLNYVSVGADGAVWGVNASGYIYRGSFNLPF